MASNVTLEGIRRVKKKYEAALLAMENVVGVGIGFRERAGELTDQMALIVSVSRKAAFDKIDDINLIPNEIEGVPVDVKETGEIRALN